MPAHLHVDYNLNSLIEANYPISFLFIGSTSSDSATATLEWNTPPKNAPAPPSDPDEPKEKKTKKEKRQDRRNKRKKFLYPD